jgi:Xaa-Pro aminopeptidase
MGEKDRRLLELCRARGVEGVHVRRRSNFAWLTDGADVHVDSSSQIGIASILWTPERKVVLTSNIEAARLRAEELGSEWEVSESKWFEPAAAPEGNFASDWPEDVLVDLRAPLTDPELARARELGRDVAEVFGLLMHDVHPGWSELEAEGRLRQRLLAREIDAPVVLIAADDRIARFRHPIPTARRFERTLMAVLCARRRGLIVAITRLVHFGELSAELRRKHEAVCAVDAALHAASSPGTRWCDALAVARRTYEAAGFPDEWQLHHQGGPMGYEPRDYLATPLETRTIRERQLIGWNPSITGTKSEDTILSDGEVLTAVPDWPMLGSRPDILRRAAP